MLFAAKYVAHAVGEIGDQPRHACLDELTHTPLVVAGPDVDAAVGFAGIPDADRIELAGDGGEAHRIVVGVAARVVGVGVEQAQVFAGAGDAVAGQHRGRNAVAE